VLAVLVVLLAAGVFPLTVLAGQSLLSNVGQVVTFLPIAAVGFLVARHQPRNPIGWLLLACATATLLSADATLYVWLVYRLGHRLPLGPVAVLLAMTWTILFLTLPLVILLFPDGKLPSPRWRWVLWAYLAAVLCLVVSIYVAVVSTIVAHDVRIDASGGLTALDSPSGRTAWMSAVPVVIFPVLGAFWLSFVGRLVLSWRRTTAERRQQLKWLLSGSAISLVSGLIGNFIGVFDPHAPAAVQAVISFINDFGFVALAVCVGVAILKYRLYEIDRLISRTLAYAIVTGLLVGVYAGLVLLATQVLTIKSPIAVAGSTLATAALFSPLRARVQRLVDRRFNRARYDADRTVVAFAARLQDAIDLDGVRADLVATIHGVLEPAHVSVWMTERR